MLGMSHRSVHQTTPICLDQSLFRAALTRERKRAERANRAILLTLLDVRTPSGDGLQADPAGLPDVLSRLESEIDTLGWHTADSVLGLITPDLPQEEAQARREQMDVEIRRELVDRYGLEVLERVVITTLLFPECLIGARDGLDVDPAFYPEFAVNRQARGSYHLLKRGFDVAVSCCLMIALAPLLLAIAVLVKWTSPGPVLFWQERVGRMMTPFRMCKFRTMYTNADHGVHHHYVSWFITASGTAAASDAGTVFKLTNDTRITPVGRILRRTSLDELPQLWNVLIGEMALVGPRPPLPYELKQYKPWHRHRVLEAKPGITGLWQVVGRSRTTFDEMVRLDVQYVRTMTLWRDMKILLATPRAVITGKGAC